MNSAITPNFCLEVYPGPRRRGLHAEQADLSALRRPITLESRGVEAAGGAGQVVEKGVLQKGTPEIWLESHESLLNTELRCVRPRCTQPRKVTQEL